MQPTYCVSTAHIAETQDNFYACTQLPISTFTKNGQLIYTTGLAKATVDKIMKTKLIKIAYKKFSLYNYNNYVIHTIDNEDFIAVYICQKDISQGMFIIGPYTRSVELMPFLVALLRNLQEDYIGIKNRNTCQIQPYSLHVQKALKYINENYSTNITLESIAQYLRINKCYFATIFKQETGQTFSTTLNQIRIEKSKEYLTKKKYSILDVALNAGFSNQNYYSTMFKRITNMTPSEFRKKMVAN